MSAALHSDEDLRDLRAKGQIERAAGLTVEDWNAEMLQARAPYLAKSLAGGNFCPTEGKADPFRVTPLFAKRSVELGVDLRRDAGRRR